jgi:hypothetical protein
LDIRIRREYVCFGGVLNDTPLAKHVVTGTLMDAETFINILKYIRILYITLVGTC